MKSSVLAIVEQQSLGLNRDRGAAPLRRHAIALPILENLVIVAVMPPCAPPPLPRAVGGRGTDQEDT
jgi:hypothetical protein